MLDKQKKKTDRTSATVLVCSEENQLCSFFFLFFWPVRPKDSESLMLCHDCGRAQCAIRAQRLWGLGRQQVDMPPDVAAAKGRLNCERVAERARERETASRQSEWSKAPSSATSRPPPAGPIINRFDLSWREGSQLEALSAGRFWHHDWASLHMLYALCQVCATCKTFFSPFFFYFISTEMHNWRYAYESGIIQGVKKLVGSSETTW